MKSFFAIAVLFIVGLVAVPDVKAQRLTTDASLPTATRIVSSAGILEVQDTINKLSVCLPRGQGYYNWVTVGSGVGARLAIVQGASQRVVFNKPASSIKITGTGAPSSQTDSLKVNAAKLLY